MVMSSRSMYTSIIIHTNYKLHHDVMQKTISEAWDFLEIRFTKQGLAINC